MLYRGLVPKKLRSYETKKFRKYNKDNLSKQMEKVDLIERKELLQNNEKINSKKNIPLELTYSRTLPKISELVRKN